MIYYGNLHIGYHSEGDIVARVHITVCHEFYPHFLCIFFG